MEGITLSCLLAEARAADIELGGGEGEEEVVGLVVLDQRGLVVTEQGELEPGAAGLLQRLIASPDSPTPGEVAVHTSTSARYIVKREAGLTVAVVKKLQN